MLKSRYFREDHHEADLFKKLDDFLATLTKEQIISVSHSTLMAPTKAVLTVVVIYEEKDTKENPG